MDRTIIIGEDAEGNDYFWEHHSTELPPDANKFRLQLRRVDSQWGTTMLCGEITCVQKGQGLWQAQHLLPGGEMSRKRLSGGAVFRNLEKATIWLLQQVNPSLMPEAEIVEKEYHDVHWQRADWHSPQEYRRNYLVSANTTPDGSHVLGKVMYKDSSLGRGWELRSEGLNKFVLVRDVPVHAGMEHIPQFAAARKIAEDALLEQWKLHITSAEEVDGSKEAGQSEAEREAEEARQQEIRYCKEKLEQWNARLLEVARHPIKKGD
jgi:hypothetical protein